LCETESRTSGTSEQRESLLSPLRRADAPPTRSAAGANKEHFGASRCTLPLPLGASRCTLPLPFGASRCTLRGGARFNLAQEVDPHSDMKRVIGILRKSSVHRHRSDPMIADRTGADQTKKKAGQVHAPAATIERRRAPTGEPFACSKGTTCPTRLRHGIRCVPRPRSYWPCHHARTHMLTQA